MNARHRSRALLILSLATLVSCSSGLRIVDDGFSSTDLGEGRWAVKFESNSVRSDAEAEANLMVHTARWAIDHGASYFTVHELIVGSETKLRSETGAVTSPATAAQEGGTATSPVDETKSSRLTASREGRYTARGQVRLWQQRPESVDAELYDAGKVLDRYAGMRGRTTVSRITVTESAAP